MGSSSSPPPPDPAIGESAKMQAQTAQDALNWYKSIYSSYIQPEQAKMDALSSEVAHQQMGIAADQQKQSDAYFSSWQNNTLPALQQYSKNALNFNTDAYRQSLASQAASDAASAFTATMGANDRAMESMGVNPNSGAFVGLRKQNALALAASRAGAMSGMRMQALTYGNQLLAQSAGLGSYQPGSASGAAGVAAGAASGAVGSAGTGIQTGLQGINTAGQGFNTGLAGYTGAANTYNAQYGNQVNAWGMQQQANAAMWGGVGQLAGTGAGLYAAHLLSTGGAAAAT